MSTYNQMIHALVAAEATAVSAQAVMTEMVKGLAGALSAVKPDSNGKRTLPCEDARLLAEAIVEEAPGEEKKYRDKVNMMVRRASQALELHYLVGFSFSVKSPEDASFTVKPVAEEEEIDVTDSMVAIAGALRALANGNQRTITRALAMAKDAAEPSLEALNLALQEYSGLV